jgi:acetylglutamate kinase
MQIVLKYGGNAMAAVGAPDTLLDEIAERSRGGDRIVVVHGGGPQIDAELAAHGIVTQRVDGLRVTDAATLAITERVLCGEVNKALVRALSRRGARAVGISGEDAGLVRARAMQAAGAVSLGFVGEVTAVDPALLDALLEKGFLPVVAPVAIDEDGSTALNVNADTTAGAIAGAIGADAYLIVTDVARVRRDAADPNSEIARMTASEARAYLESGVFEGGMRPKVESALAALGRGAASVVIGGRGPGAIGSALSGNGTTLVAD